MKVIKNFKFVSNLEFVHSILKEHNILHAIDLENLSISSDEFERNKILQIIEDLKLDENEVEVDDNFQKDFDDWHQNSLNPGHFMGGRIPFFYWNKKNYPFLFFTIFFPSIAMIIIMVFIIDGEPSFEFDFATICLYLFQIFVAISMIVQWLQYRKQKK
ncbi:hypothetical protein KSK37_02765 [Kaistella sp. DKR-2]|uniref:hypothetical protein n=1 Tax=Kaistella soli TaxID=2849654 RepID=UPI001C25ACF4|nr:hypothetical protein [Kaistella soli]MBU8881999.1 hypothetical protein [Kaistella soli]